MSKQTLPLDEQVIPLLPGNTAPDFVLAGTQKARVSLAGLRGHRVVLVFYPLDGELITREQLSLFQANLRQISQFDALVFGISVDPVSNHEAFARELGLDFSLLSDSDPKGAVSRLYGVYREGMELSARALFVVDGRRIIWFSEAYPDSVNPGVDSILSTLATIAEADKLASESDPSLTALEAETDQAQKSTEAMVVLIAGFATALTIALIFLVYVVLSVAHLA